MSTVTETKRESVTVYRAVAVAATPIATREFADKTWWPERRHVGSSEVQKSAGAWIQHLEQQTGRDLEDDSTVTIKVETRTTRTITIVDTTSRTQSVLRPESDRYGNQYWREGSKTDDLD